MAFTSKFGTVDSKYSNEVFGLGANSRLFVLFSGLYKLVDGKTDDTMYVTITYPTSTTVDVAIPNPFVETAFFDPEDLGNG